MAESSTQQRERMSKAAAVPADKPKAERDVDFGRGVGSVASGMTANEASSQVTIAMLVLGLTIIVGHGLLSQFRAWVESRVTDTKLPTLPPIMDNPLYGKVPYGRDSQGNLYDARGQPITPTGTSIAPTKSSRGVTA